VAESDSTCPSPHRLLLVHFFPQVDPLKKQVVSTVALILAMIHCTAVCCAQAFLTYSQDDPIFSNSEAALATQRPAKALRGLVGVSSTQLSQSPVDSKPYWLIKATDILVKPSGASKLVAHVQIANPVRYPPLLGHIRISVT